MDNLLDSEHINGRICNIRVKLNYYKFTFISTHSPTDGKEAVAKDEF
jgi:hypothetical protein